MKKAESKRARTMDRKLHPVWSRLPEAPANSLANHGQPWSEADDERLWEIYPTHGTEYTAAILGRTPGAVSSRASGLGVPGFDSTRIERATTDERSIERGADGGVDPRFSPTRNARNAICAMMGNRSIAEIAQLYGTTPGSIAAVAREERVTAARWGMKWSRREDRFLHESWRLMSPTAIAHELERSVYEIKERAARIGVDRSHRQWSAADDRFLVDHADDMSPDELATTLGRTKAAVGSRIRRILGRRRELPMMWSAKHDRILRSSYHRLSVEEIAQRVGRSTRSVYARAQQLGLSARHWQPWEDRLLGELHGTMPQKELVRRLGRSHQAIMKRITTLGLAREHFESYHFYDPRHDETLRALHGTIPDAELAERVGVPRYRLRHHLQRLGLVGRRNRVWSAEDDAFIRASIATMSNEQIAEHLGATPGAVRAHMRHLGVERDGKRRPWSAAEDALLRAKYPTEPIDTLVEMLGRTRHSITVHAQRLGVARTTSRATTSGKQSRAKHPAAEVLRKREWPDGVPMPKAGAYASRNIWSRIEDQKLRAHYNRYGVKYCARLLGRSTAAVTIRASRIGIAELNVAWTAREDAYLRRHHLTQTSSELATNTGRTVVAVRVRLRHLGLREPKAWSPKEMALLKKHYGTMKSDELARLIGRSGGAVRNMASELGLSTAYRTITPDEELAIVALIGSEPLATIAERFGTFPTRVSKIARKHGIDPELVRQDRWSAEHDQFLRDNWATMSLPDIARHVGRNRAAVHAHAANIGLSPEDSQYGRTKRWTPEDDRRLRELYGTMSRREIAALMGRPPASIKHRAQRLGLRMKDGA